MMGRAYVSGKKADHFVEDAIARANGELGREGYGVLTEFEAIASEVGARLRRVLSAI